MSQPLPTHSSPGRPKSIKGRVIAGIICIVLAVLGVVASLVFLIAGLFSVDGDVPVDGQPHTVSLDSEAERMVFVQDGATIRCSVLDEDGTPVELDEVRGEFTKSVNGEDRVGVWSFTPPGDSVEVTCTGDDQLDVEVGPSAISGSRMAIMGIGFGLSSLLGVIGLILLITALVRWSRRSRS
ncbi:hypothetical protein BJ980_001081 [Nocardioides daedukensis]|uniref:Uncharacterized protein n=1 Tax=Nocardioides daedukensis TaxID=634462 RepID=A0A7Y9S0Z2_9ACTN|nr:hypothetical protein [Nocardioides daedukensis]NYG58158.1 hypothetical protein [Nocardioides daedukensis]